MATYDLSKLDRRTDASLWAHPEMEQAYEMSAQDGGTLANFYDPDVPFEERRAAVVASEAEWAAMLAVPMGEGTRKVEVPGCEEEPETTATIWVTEPEGIEGARPCVIVVPAGGLTMCQDNIIDKEGMAKRFGAVVVTPVYRTVFSGKGGYPGTVNDLDACYKWVVENAAEIGVDPDRIVIRGESSGGQLTLALAHRLKRKGYYGYVPRGCVVESAIIDFRRIYPSMMRIDPGWGGIEAFTTGDAWLGRHRGERLPEAFANHATAEECVGLPPTFIHTFESDSSVDVALEYASKLVQAGVCCDLHLWSGNNHSSLSLVELVPEYGECPYAERMRSVIESNVQECLDYDLRRTWIPDFLEADGE